MTEGSAYNGIIVRIIVGEHRQNRPWQTLLETRGNYHGQASLRSVPGIGDIGHEHAKSSYTTTKGRRLVLIDEIGGPGKHHQKGREDTQPEIEVIPEVA